MGCVSELLAAEITNVVCGYDRIMTLRAAIYARISLDRKDEAGVKRQAHLATKLAEAEEATIVAEYTDNNASAFSGAYRPEYENLLKSIEAGELDVVYVYALDRLTRRTKDTLSLFELCEKHGVRIKATQGYSIDPSDPSSRIIIVILGLIAEQESIDRAARIRASYVDCARVGRPKTGGRRMLGYEANAETIIETEAQAIRDAAVMILAGKTLRETVREIFHARGITATSGRDMTAPTLRDILLNPRVRGISTFNPTDPVTGYRLIRDRQIIGPGQWPAIIDEATGEKLDAVLRDPSRRRSHAGNAPTRYLASVLTCTCGDPMYSRTRAREDGSRKRYYACGRGIPGGTHVTIGDEVDSLIERVIIGRMSKPDGLELLQQSLSTNKDSTETEELQELVSQRNALLARLELLEDSLVDGEIGVDAFTRLEKKIAEQLTGIDDRLQNLTSARSADPLAAELIGVKDFAQWWVGASVEDKRRLTRILMDIHILPGTHGAKKFDPTRVQVTWH